MSQFFALPVTGKKQETSDAVSISFLIPDDLKDKFRYKAGQYLTLEVDINGEKLRRAYSLCSCPLTDDQLTVTVKRVDDGKVSSKLNGPLQLGQSIMVMPPEGRFTPEINADNKKHYFLFAGGSGITPMMSIIRTVLKAEPNSCITLVYANRNKNSVIFKNELEELAKTEKGRLDVVHSFDTADMFWFGLKGFLTSDAVKKQVLKHERGMTNEFYICGPAAMMDTVKNGLLEMNVPKDAINIEYFIAPTAAKVENQPVTPANVPTTAAPVISTEGTQLKLSINGETHDIFVKNKKTILAAAQDAGLDPPYSCEAGICSTCMAKVTAGKVRMIENNILTEKEVSNGYILTCQALCESPEVSVEYYD
jgi:ring-1,2-phenylacetyl-CoA epoxidase subunit PaaE